MEIKKEDIQEMFERYIGNKRRAYASPQGSYDEAYFFGEVAEAERWLSYFGVDLSYPVIYEMCNGNVEVNAFWNLSEEEGSAAGSVREQSRLIRLIESAIDDCCDDGERGHSSMTDFNGKIEVFTRLEKSGESEDPLVIVTIVENGNPKFTYAEHGIKCPAL